MTLNFRTGDFETWTDPRQKTWADTIGSYLGAQDRGSISTHAAYVETASTGLTETTPANLRTGLSTATAPGGGFVEELEIQVTGTAGERFVTSTQTSKVAGLGTDPWEAALVADDGTAFFDTVLGHDGSTRIDLRHPLTADFTGVISAKYAEANSQHLTRNGTIAYAAHLARQSAAECCLGGTLDGVWSLRNGIYFEDVWTKNPALEAYGVSNSASPPVQSGLKSASARNLIETSDGLPARTSGLNRLGVTIGTHEAGHGAIATLRTKSEDARIEFWTGAYRPGVALQDVAITVTAKANGVEIYRATTDHILKRHAFLTHGSDTVTIEITNADGGIYHIAVAELTARQIAHVGKLFPRGAKIATFGDSWFDQFDGLFAKTLASATGCRVENHAKGGMTTEYAVAWFNELIRGRGYQACVIHFFINDRNRVGGTFTDPDGNEIETWPDGLSLDQSRDLWVANINKLVALCQADGIRPIIMKPGGTASNSQTATLAKWVPYIDRSHPVDWVATEAELLDHTSFVNTRGKFTGASCAIGQGVVFAAGRNPEDGWKNPMNDALLPLQGLAFTSEKFKAANSRTIGLDTNGDGMSDGLGIVGWGTTETNGETYEASIIDGRQRYVSNFTSGNSGGKRLKYHIPLTQGGQYFALIHVVNGTPYRNMEALSTITGSGTETFGYDTLDATGSGVFFHRATAGRDGSFGWYFGAGRTNDESHAFELTNKSGVYDLTALAQDCPNIKGMSDDQIAALIISMQ